MALFSDVDWAILLVAAAFLLFGKESGPTLRMLGRWYARAGRIKQELLEEFAKAADLPTVPGTPLTIRGALLGLDPAPTHTSGIPAAVTVAPVASASAPTSYVWNAGMPAATWTMTMSVEPGREAWSR
jgi:hypothetical protein